MLTWVLALTLCSAAIALIGENPLSVWQILFSSAFGNLKTFTFEPFSWTLFYATPLFFTSASVSTALEAGLFNIGAEGQLYWGAIGATTFALYWAPHNVFGIFGAIICAALLGGLWGTLAAVLRNRFQIHEVISGIMLNFIAAGIANWAILGPLKNPDTQALESRWIAEAIRLKPLSHHIPLGILLGLICLVATVIVIHKTWWGYRVRAVGLNARAADVAGIKSTRVIAQTFFVSGALAGLVGFNEVFSHAYRLLDGFSPGFGFTGLAIALLARGKLPGLIGYSLLFGALYKGTLDLDLETEKITRDFAGVIQALILFSLIVASKLRWKRS